MLASWHLQAATPAAAAVDFSHSCVVAVLAGSRPSSAYRLRVVKTQVRDGRVVATVSVRQPAGAIGAMAISRPWAVVEVAREAVVDAAPEVTIRGASPDKS